MGSWPSDSAALARIPFYDGARKGDEGRDIAHPQAADLGHIAERHRHLRNLTVTLVCEIDVINT